MNATDQKKVIDAGFTILRRQDLPKPHIKMKTSANPYDWRKYEDFETKASRDRVMSEFLKKANYIED